MDTSSDSSPDEKATCDVCHKEVPLSVALRSEAADYVVHFCGLDCYAKWKQQSDGTVPQSGDAKK